MHAVEPDHFGISKARPKILMVDDRKENLMALEKLLKDVDVELYPATSGNEALRLTLYHDFALALLDIQMPEMDGYELAGLLRQDEKTSRMPFIFISAIYTDHINVFKGYEKGAFSYITKPFEPRILINKVRFFMEKFQQEEALKRAHEALEQHVEDLKTANEELRSFSYSVSHDLRAPLRVISGYSNILLEDYGTKLDEEGKKIINTIVRNTNKMSDLIDDILDFSRLTRQEKDPRPVDMNKMVDTVYSELTEHLTDRKIRFVGQKVEKALGDEIMIRQLLVNLLGNAVKYTRPCDEVVIEFGGYRKNGDYVYYVKDNGVGFDDTYKGKLFGVFQRLHKETEFEGTGIGLAIANKVVRQHGGRIWGEGKPGKGASFYFTLCGGLNTEEKPLMYTDD